MLLVLALALAPPAQLHVKVPMRDGVKLCTNVFRPAAPARVPALLTRTPYGKPWQLTPALKAFVDHGYAVVAQDVRGRFDSGGQFRPVLQESADGFDTIEWLIRQPWCDGNVGMFGGSYAGIAQWRAALAAHPALKAIVPVHAGWDDYTDRYYSPGGAMKLGHRLLWLAENFRRPGFAMPSFDALVQHLPLRTSDRTATGRAVDFFQDALDHPAYDGYWKAASTREKIDLVNVPTFIVAGWYDNYSESDIAAFQALQRRGVPSRLMIGAWGHSMSQPLPGQPFGADAVPAQRMLEIQWFDNWLRSGRAAAVPPVRWFLMGANEWREDKSFPPPGAKSLDIHLASGGRLLPRAESKSEPDHFDYNPRNPVPTRGGAVCCNFRLFPWGPLDQRAIGPRPDVLTFSTPPLPRDLRAAGPVRVTLYVASSAPDTDFTAKLIDLAPGGAARILSDGILRLRYRQSLEAPAPYSPGEVVKIEIPAGVTAHLFPAGHSIRLDISSSNFPRFDRNPNTGVPVADATTSRPARQAVFHDRRRPSHLTLPLTK